MLICLNFIFFAVYAAHAVGIAIHVLVLMIGLSGGNVRCNVRLEALYFIHR